MTDAKLKPLNMHGPDDNGKVHADCEDCRRSIRELTMRAGIAELREQEIMAERDALRARWEEAGKNTVNVLSDVLGKIRAADETYDDSRLLAADGDICALLDRWTGWCSPQNSFISDQRTQTVILRTAADLMKARGSTHVAIALLEAINAG